MTELEVLEQTLKTYIELVQLDWDRNNAAYPDLPVPVDIGWALSKTKQGWGVLVITVLPSPFNDQTNFARRAVPTLEALILDMQEHMARVNDAMQTEPILPRVDGVKPLTITPAAEWDIDADLDAANLRVQD